MRSSLALLVYIPLQLAILPLAILGILLQTYRQMVVSRRLGVSQTGIEVLGGRWTMHLFGMRNDEATLRLSRALPNFSGLGMWTALFPLWVYAKIAGRSLGYPRIVEPGAEDLRDLVTARTAYIDDFIGQELGEMEQVVLMGAGYDTRAYGEFQRAGITCFELDQEATQALKRKAVDEAGIEVGETRYVRVDFERGDTFEKLAASGYDPAKKTLFLWEGVTLYLGEEAVRRALRDMRDNAAPGSVIVADLYSEAFLEMGKKKAGKKALEMTDESMDFGIPFEADHEARLKGFVESEGLSVRAASFMGTKSEGGPFMVVADIRT